MTVFVMLWVLKSDIFAEFFSQTLLDWVFVCPTPSGNGLKNQSQMLRSVSTRLVARLAMSRLGGAAVPMVYVHNRAKLG